MELCLTLICCKKHQKSQNPDFNLKFFNGYLYIWSCVSLWSGAKSIFKVSITFFFFYLKLWNLKEIHYFIIKFIKIVQFHTSILFELLTKSLLFLLILFECQHFRKFFFWFFRFGKHLARCLCKLLWPFVFSGKGTINNWFNLYSLFFYRLYLSKLEMYSKYCSLLWWFLTTKSISISGRQQIFGQCFAIFPGSIQVWWKKLTASAKFKPVLKPAW